MENIFILVIISILTVYGQNDDTRVVFIGEVPLLIAAAPAPTTATPKTPTISEPTTPAVEPMPNENVTDVKDEDVQSDMSHTTPADSDGPPKIVTATSFGRSRPKYITCNKDADCAQHKFERCRRFRLGHPGKCTCIAGHSWAKDGNSCIAVKNYRVTIKTRNEYIPNFDDRNSGNYRFLEYQAREGFYEALKASKLGPILVSAKSSCTFQNSSSGHVILDFKMRISRSYAPEQPEVHEDIVEGIRSVLQEKEEDVFTLSDTIILLDNNTISSLQVVAPDPCSSGYMNYCDQNAECMPSTRSFTCQCKEGFADVSFDKRETPGERCELQCGCSANGQCVNTEEKGVHCQCQGWYLGEKCQIEGQTLLIVLSAILGALLLIGIFCCCCCMFRMKKSFPHSDDSTSMTTLEKHQTEVPQKTPHSWVNTWRYYNFTPTYPMNNPYSSWLRPHTGQRRSSRHNRVEPQAGTIMMYPSELSIPRPQVAPVYNSSFYY